MRILIAEDDRVTARLADRSDDLVGLRHASWPSTANRRCR